MSAHEPEPEVADDAAGQAPGRFARVWGTSPWVAAGHLVVIAIAAYALSVMFREAFAPRPWNLLLWLVGGAVLHDAVLLPAYSALHVGVARLLRGRGAEFTPRRTAVLAHLRAPAVISGVLLLVFSPRIFSGQPQNFERALGHAPPDYLARWLAVTAGLFVLSGLAYVARRGRLTDDPEMPDRSAAAAAPDASR